MRVAHSSGAHSTGRRIAGWSCIALGKIGSLLLLWALISGAEPDVGDDAAGTDALFGLIGIAPLFAMTLGTIAIGIWILLKSERA
jgi:hypothetical protein